MAPSASQAGSQRWRGAHHILRDAPAWAAHGRSGLVLSCSAHAYEPGDAASPVAKCTMDRGMQKVIPGARVCSVLTQKGTAWAGLLLGPLDISTIAGQCMVGCLRMIMVHIIGGLSVGVLEDAREIAHSHTGQAILSDMHPYAMKPMIRRLVGAEICIQALRFSATKSFKGTRESPENCWLCESMVAGAQMSTQQTTGRHHVQSRVPNWTQMKLVEWNCKLDLKMAENSGQAICA